MIEDIVSRDSEEDGLFILQFLEVRVFGEVDDLILEGIVHHPHIVVYSLPFVMLDIYLVLVVCGEFIGTVGYTPGLVELVHAML